MDHHNLFNEKSEYYAKARPQYPEEIYEYLVTVCHDHKTVWDGACGNGQAAVGLARYFERIEATDISEGQIANAIQHPKVTYTVQSSEKTDFHDNQFDLVSIAQALHWFDYQLFWPEVKRVLKSRGVFAAWGYSWFSIEDRIDAIIQEEFLRHLEPYWAPQNKLLWDYYRNIPFPFERLATPEIEMKMIWNLNQLFAYLHSWSATRHCIEKTGSAFMSDAYKVVKSKWGQAGKKKIIEMDFCMIVGRNES